MPVPKGFTASQIEGETTVSGGFVIYEGDVDWSQIIVDSAEESEVTQTDTKVDEGASEITEIEANVDEGASEITEKNTNTDAGTNETEDQDNIVKEEITKTEENIPIGEPTTIEKTDIITKQATIEDTTANEAILVDETDQANETTDVATQTEINIFNLQKSTNQYVWVPIEDVTEIYGVDANGNLWGKFYDFTSLGRSALNWSETNGVMSINSVTSYREPDVIANMTDYDIDSQLPKYASGQTRYELLAKEMEQNFYEMIKSIKEYGGFYIGRYETGGLNGTAVVRKMDTNISIQTWYTMYNKCQQLGGLNDNVKTSMIWNSLFDATLEWIVDSDATNSGGTLLTYSLVSANSTTWGNYKNAEFDYITSTAITPVETTTKVVNTATRIPTGSTEYTKVNNIYDIAGNVWEGTLATNNIDSRIYRGGDYFNFSGNTSPADSSLNFQPARDGGSIIGCRVSLWIKYGILKKLKQVEYYKMGNFLQM